MGSDIRCRTPVSPPTMLRWWAPCQQVGGKSNVFLWQLRLQQGNGFRAEAVGCHEKGHLWLPVSWFKWSYKYTSSWLKMYIYIYIFYSLSELFSIWAGVMVNVFAWTGLLGWNKFSLIQLMEKNPAPLAMPERVLILLLKIRFGHPKRGRIFPSTVCTLMWKP